MAGRTLFVSDVHLNPDEPGRHSRFLDFLGRFGRGDRVHLLGDVFDYWIGPRHLDSYDYRTVLSGLRERTRSGLEISFLPGNRDYLVDRRFAEATGVTLLGEEAELELGGRRVYLAHGDFLYNRNPKYSAYRRMMRFRALRAFYLALPRTLGKGIALGFRKVSVQTTPYSSWSEEALLEGADRHFVRGCRVVICGHIHQPCHLRERDCELFVLGDWGAGGEYVEFDGTEFTMKRAL